MLKRTMAVVFAMLVVMAAGSAAAQCTLGVYADANGTVSVKDGQRNTDFFDVYVVLFTENVASAASYDLFVPGEGVDIFAGPPVLGPNGNGINVDTDLFTSLGNNVGLGECAVGFGGLPVVVARHSFVFPDFALPRTLNIAPTSDESAFGPVMSDCVGNLIVCGLGATLLVEGPIATEAASFGEVKGLYRN